MRPMRTVKIPPPTDNFHEWFSYYASVLECYYRDFVKLFEVDTEPSFEDFSVYCYNNTKCQFNNRKRRYECKIYRDY